VAEAKETAPTPAPPTLVTEENSRGSVHPSVARPSDVNQSAPDTSSTEAPAIPGFAAGGLLMEAAIVACLLAIAAALLLPAVQAGVLQSPALSLLVACIGGVFITGHRVGSRQTGVATSLPPASTPAAASQQYLERQLSRERELTRELASEVAKLEADLALAWAQPKATASKKARKVGSTNGESSAILAFEGRNWLAD